MTAGDYRYTLERQLGSLWTQTRGLFVMLNPSTADETTDDATIRRCKGFATREGWVSFRVVNLYAVRTTMPAEMVAWEDPVGPENDAVLVREIGEASVVVAAWGAHSCDELAKFGGTVVGRFMAVRAALGERAVEWKCLGTTTNGAPRHPLFVQSQQPLLPWDPSKWRPLARIDKAAERKKEERKAKRKKKKRKAKVTT